ncbi:MAG TPA: hypothetical protein VLR46_14680, partial [Candidatus Dormibacteraeota bacterium]|nr:hypothetical protein [Candidatus Dormibacteraeota bacterium]
MQRQPWGDTLSWDVALGHRPPEMRGEVSGRFDEHGVAAELVKTVLDDCGDSLYAAARSGDRDWADRFGGPLAAALLAAEVSSLAAHLNSRASAVRALAVDALLDEFSAVTVASRLGVSRQKVYEIGRGTSIGPYINLVPWRQK